MFYTWPDYNMMPKSFSLSLFLISRMELSGWSKMPLLTVYSAISIESLAPLLDELKLKIVGNSSIQTFSPGFIYKKFSMQIISQKQNKFVSKVNWTNFKLLLFLWQLVFLILLFYYVYFPPALSFLSKFSVFGCDFVWKLFPII